ncbi:hypothetical protein ACI2JA_03750 [Alkalihalobacillus sp. NPDC078783]
MEKVIEVKKSSLGDKNWFQGHQELVLVHNSKPKNELDNLFDKIRMFDEVGLQSDDEHSELANELNKLAERVLDCKSDNENINMESDL